MRCFVSKISNGKSINVIERRLYIMKSNNKIDCIAYDLPTYLINVPFCRY